MRDDDVPAGLDHVGDVMGSDRSFLELIPDREMILVADKGIAANCDNRKSGFICHFQSPRSAGRFAASAETAPAKQSRGARVMPAPIWPMPASLWAMPVLITGQIPVSTTLRASTPEGVPANPIAGSVNPPLRP